MIMKSIGGVLSKVKRAVFANRTRAVRVGEEHDFVAGDCVRPLGPVKNDGGYVHRKIGEILVLERDLGVVHERWNFLGQIYYTVEFVDRAVVVIMRGRELAKVDEDDTAKRQPRVVLP
jgi:nitrogen fixation protein NifZ